MKTVRTFNWQLITFLLVVSLNRVAGGAPVLVAWEDNSLGQTTVPNGLTNVVAIATGDYHNLAVTAEGRVVGWGYNADGEINVPSDLTNVVAVAAGSYHSLALTAEGRGIGWGTGGSGQLNVPNGLSNVAG